MASRWSPGSTTSRPTTSSCARSRRSTTSSTAAPRAPTSAPATAPGILHPAPRRASSAPSSTFELPEPRALRRRRLLPAARRGAAPQDRGAARAQRARRGPARPGLARRADRRGARRRDRRRRRGRSSASSSSAPATRPRADDQDAFERKLYVIRRIVELAAGPDFYVAELLLADLRLQGDAHLPAGRAASTPTCRTSASRARWRSCTRASRRTPSRAGSSPTRSA